MQTPHSQSTVNSKENHSSVELYKVFIVSTHDTSALEPSLSRYTMESGTDSITMLSRRPKLGGQYKLARLVVQSGDVTDF